MTNSNTIVKSDNEGNLISINKVTESQIIIKLELKGKTGRKVLNIGTVNPTNKCFEIKRKRTKHLHRKSNGYGFNHYVLSTGQLFEYVLLTDEYGTYKVPVSVILAVGKFLYFKQEGFEKQIFMPIEQIEQYKL